MPEREPGTEDAGDISGRPQDPFVSQRKPTPEHRPERTLVLSGLLGDSDRSGHRRLYFNRNLDYYAEFATDDVLAAESVQPDQAPFVGMESTRVTLRRDARVSFTRIRSTQPLDEFDIDARFGAFGRSGAGRAIYAMPPQTQADPCDAPTWANCPTDLCDTHNVCATEFACHTDNDQCGTGVTDCRPRTHCDCPQVQTDQTCATCRCGGPQQQFPTVACPTVLTCPC
jgi:hypothetical protein